LITCNCDWGCPCNGLNFSVCAKWPGAIRNAVTGAEAHPGILLPEGVILKRADLGKTTHFRVSHGMDFDHSGKYMALGPFEYQGRT
jgi:hypothetical protein